VTNGVMNWTVGDKGVQQLIRVGSYAPDVMSGDHGGGDSNKKAVSHEKAFLLHLKLRP
jgi:hypothetical protein